MMRGYAETETVFQEWKALEAEIAKQGLANAAQREWCRRMFYAGAHTMYHLTHNVCRERDESDDDRQKRITDQMRTLHDEVKALDTDLRFRV
jgi:hypothetical protein